MLQEALSEDVKDTYNMVSVDGDTSTNDTVLLLANGDVYKRQDQTGYMLLHKNVYSDKAPSPRQFHRNFQKGVTA